MFDKFSVEARRVLFWARKEAGRLGSEAIEPEHLLLGFLAEDQGEPGRLQVAGEPVGVEPSIRPHEPFLSSKKAFRLRQLVTTSGAKAEHSLPENMDMALAEQSQRDVIAAQERAGTSTVGLLHILWALSIDKHSNVGGLLMLNGVIPEKVEDALSRGDY